MIFLRKGRFSIETIHVVSRKKDRLSTGTVLVISLHKERQIFYRNNRFAFPKERQDFPGTIHGGDSVAIGI